jgi:hypothetical protein
LINRFSISQNGQSVSSAINERIGHAWRSYILLVSWAILIFLTIPFARTIQKFFVIHFGESFFGYLVLSSIVVALGVSIFWIKRFSNLKLSVSNYLWLIGVAGVYIYYTVKLWEMPEETVHFLEYGVLSYFTYKALRHHVNDNTIYLSALMIVLFIGTLDEMVQWMVPERYWDIRDVRLNFFSGLLLQLAIFKGIQPKGVVLGFSPASLRILSISVILCTVLLGLCASNTPVRIAHYSSKISSLSFLASNHAMMSEYGFLHRESNIGTFYSRYRKQKLLAVDGQKNSEYSEMLNRWGSKKYKEFLNKFNPISNAFLHEMRVHLFRRDTYLSRAQAEERPVKRKAYFTIAYKENLILEKYFGKTLGRTVYYWDQNTRDAVKRESDPEADYQSPVSSNLFTSFTEKQLWSLVGGIACALLLVNIWMNAWWQKKRKSTNERGVS